MGKTRPPDRAKLSKRNKHLLSQKQAKNQPSPEQLLAQAVVLVQTSEADSALPIAHKALTILQSKHDANAPQLLPAINLLGEINVELGEIETARAYFAHAAEIDADGSIAESTGGGAEKFLWLAQLSEDGGEDSVKWFQKGVQVLRNRITRVESSRLLPAEKTAQIEETKSKLASALCGIAEVYMTDLSFNDAEAERQCNLVMEEAISIAPDNAEILQTLASVRISQQQKDEAQIHLKKSLATWSDLDPEDDRVPPFPTRISLARLLMEAEMEDEAIEVLERLVQEDDHSVETWYLGGWCLNLIAQKKQQETENGADTTSKEEIVDLLKRSRRWLLQCRKLYQMLEYEDERLNEHTTELIDGLNFILGEPSEEEELAAEEEDDWEDEVDGDEEMDET